MGGFYFCLSNQQINGFIRFKKVTSTVIFQRELGIRSLQGFSSRKAYEIYKKNIEIFSN